MLYFFAINLLFLVFSLISKNEYAKLNYLLEHNHSLRENELIHEAVNDGVITVSEKRQIESNVEVDILTLEENKLSEKERFLMLMNRVDYE